MKKIIVFTMLLTVSAASFSQQINPSPAFTKQDYLKKSKNQKTAAWILLAGGMGMIITGTVIWSNEVNHKIENDPFGIFYAPYTTTSGSGITAAGLIVTAASIPLFIVSAKNKRKAMSVSLRNETMPQLKNESFVNQPLPSLTLKISL
jgi:uncharacterized membrane protein YidH (DUF202 family)